MLSGLKKWLKRLLGGPPSAKVPLLGVEGSGKSSLLYTLAEYVSRNHWGHAPDKGGVLDSMRECVLSAKPIPPTLNHSALEVVLRRVPDGLGGQLETDLTISCRDVPGGNFRRLADELEEQPGAGRSRLKEGGLVGEFGHLLRDAAGLIIVLDIVRDLRAEEFRRYPQLSFERNCGEQIRPVLRALRYAQQLNDDALRDKPVLFAWTKPDIHGLSREKCDEMFERTFAIDLRSLEAGGVVVHRHDVQSAGWGKYSDLANLGVDRLLIDIAHAVGAASHPRRKS
jgi:hypothetical protein